MSGNFEFMSSGRNSELRKIAKYAKKSERYLHNDREICMFFLSRAFDIAVKFLCSRKNISLKEKNGRDRPLFDMVKELYNRKFIDEAVFHVLEMMRDFRNGNAHNKNYSLDECITVMQQAHILCEIIMQDYGDEGYKRKGGFEVPKEVVIKQFGIEDTYNSYVIGTRKTGVLVSVFNGIIKADALPSEDMSVYSPGDWAKVKVEDISEKGKISLSLIKHTPSKTHPNETVSQPEPAKPESVPEPVSEPEAQAISDEKLIELCKNGKSDDVIRALDGGANPNAKNSKGITAFMYAVTYCSLKAIIAFIRKKVDVKAKTNRGMTAIINAALSRGPEVIQILLAAGALMNVDMWVVEQTNIVAHKNPKLIGTHVMERLENIYRRTCSHARVMERLEINRNRPDTSVAPEPQVPAMPDFKFINLCKEGKPEAVRKALNEGANVNSKNHMGTTALMFAIRYNNSDVVSVILGADPDLNARNSEGRNALMYAAEFSKAPGTINLLLNAGMNVNAKDPNGWTTLMIAVRYNTFEVIQVILGVSSDVNAKNNNGITALMIGAEIREPEIVNLLLNAYANPNARTNTGQNVLMYAVQNRKTLNSSKVIEALLDAGADISFEALMAAQQNFYLKNTEALRRLKDEYRRRNPLK